jgi:ferritin-like metal-binding protein YciE
MNQSEQKVLQYLEEAHAMESGLVRVIQAQIRMTPRNGYRRALESHLTATRDHAHKLGTRIGELKRGSEPLRAVLGLAESLVAQAFALGKTPFDLLRGSGGEEKVLKNAKDTCAAEALEIATYTALERFARSVKDDVTAKLAATIRADEEKMLERVLQEIPRLVDAVVEAEVDGAGSYDLAEIGAADAARDVVAGAKAKAREVDSRARGAARNARKIPGVARAEGQIKGAVASEHDLPIGGYGDLTAAEVVERLSGLSQVDLAKIDSYERRGRNRSTILAKIATLREREPWPGYDDLNADEVRRSLREADEELAADVHSYERSHKNRSTVLEEVEAERVGA